MRPRNYTHMDWLLAASIDIGRCLDFGRWTLEEVTHSAQCGDSGSCVPEPNPIERLLEEGYNVGQLVRSVTVLACGTSPEHIVMPRMWLVPVEVLAPAVAACR